MINNIKELKEAIKNLPDDLSVGAYNGGPHLVQIAGWLSEDGKHFVIDCD
jgi:hypothetical protein